MEEIEVEVVEVRLPKQSDAEVIHELPWNDENWQYKGCLYLFGGSETTILQWVATNDYEEYKRELARCKGYRSLIERVGPYHRSHYIECVNNQVS